MLCAPVMCPLIAILFHCRNITHFTHFTAHGHLSSFQFGIVMNIFALKIFVNVSFGVYVSMCRSGVAGLWSVPVFSCAEYC